MRKKFQDMYLLRVEDGGDGSGSTSSGQQDKGFPDGTPVADMTPEQQVNYWKDKARKHEDRAKSGIRPDDHQKVKDELEALKSSQLSDQDKLLEDAKSAARAEGESAAAERYLRELVTARLQVATGQNEDVLEYIDHKAFLTDSGEVDADKVNQYAERSGNTQADQRRKDADSLGSMDAGKRGTHDGGKPSVETGRERYLARVQKTK